jgi:hypothetical protein
MVARANLLLRASGTSIIRPSSGVAGLASVTCVSPIDKRLGKLGDRGSIVRVSPMSKRAWGADSDLGIAENAIVEGVNIGESGGTKGWMTLLFSVISGGFDSWGGTWVFLGSTSI